jgi:hypothetical protein
MIREVRLRSPGLIVPKQPLTAPVKERVRFTPPLLLQNLLVQWG